MRCRARALPRVTSAWRVPDLRRHPEAGRAPQPRVPGCPDQPELPQPGTVIHRGRPHRGAPGGALGLNWYACRTSSRSQGDAPGPNRYACHTSRPKPAGRGRPPGPR